MAATDHKPDFEQLIAALPRSTSALSSAVMRLALDGEELQAESILRLGISRTPSTELRVTLSRILMRQDRHKEAMTEMVAVLRSDPENAQALLILAMSLTECGELERGGKMLQKARLAGADEGEAAAAENRWRELVGHSEDPLSADLTLPDIGNKVRQVSEQMARQDAEERGRHETLMGRPGSVPAIRGPSATAPRRSPPPPLESGSFASLDTWDIEDANENDLDTAAIAPEKVRLSDEGPLVRVPMGVDESDDYADPDDLTGAIMLDEENDPTSHIPQSKLDEGLRLAREADGRAHMASLPSVEYEQAFAEEARAHSPPSDLDDLPPFDAADAGFQRPPEAPGWNAPAPAEHQPSLEESPVARSLLDYGDWNEIPALSANSAFSGFGEQEPPPHFQNQPRFHTPTPPPQFQPAPQFQQQRQQQQAYAPPAPPQYQSDQLPPAGQFELQGNAPPSGYGFMPTEPPRRQHTAIAAEPRAPAAASGSLRILIEKRWPLVLVIVVAIFLGGFLAVTIGSGMSLTSSMQSGIAAATEARGGDTFTGYVTAEQKLVEMANLHSFMGGGFDRFVETTIPVPGLSGANLRRRGVADLAATAAVLEYRFEKVGDRKASDRLAQAKDLAPDEPATSVAEAYVALGANRPAEALALLEAAQTRHAGDEHIVEALGWTLLALGRPQDAAKATQDLRSVPAPTVHQQYLVASIDGAIGAKGAADGFANVFAASPDHVDSRIGRAYALLGGDDKALADANKVLDTVLTKLADTSSSFQKARATSAYGSLYLAMGKAAEGEERFRDALAKMPTRGELYVPLLRHLSSTGKPDEIDALLEKAKSNGAYIPAVVLFEAEYRIMRSQPEAALAALDELKVDDAPKAFWRGLALLDQYKADAAVTALESGRNAPGDATNAQAAFYLARAIASADAVDDALYQLDRLKTKQADNPFVHWAAAVVALTGAETTSSKQTRTDRLKDAARDADRAAELAPTWAPAHFARCEVFQRELELDKADEACGKGRKLAPLYAPGLVSTARLTLTRGKFEEAQKLADEGVKLRPSDPVVGLLHARIALERRELTKAGESINRWLGKPADKYEMAVLEGRLEFARENYTRAAGYLKAAYEMRPNEGEASIYYAHTLARLGDTTNAGKLLLEYLNHPTWSGYAWATLGEVRRKQRRTKDALTNLAKAEGIYRKQSVPDRYWSHLYTEYALAYQAKLRSWRKPVIKKMLDRGRSKGDPDDPGLNMTYGQYYLGQRRPDYALAMRHIEKVVEVAPNRCDAIAALRQLYTRAQKPEASLKTLEELHAANCASQEAEAEAATPKKKKKRKR